jgi:hypothetical protein
MIQMQESQHFPSWESNIILLHQPYAILVDAHTSARYLLFIVSLVSSRLFLLSHLYQMQLFIGCSVYPYTHCTSTSASNSLSNLHHQWFPSFISTCLWLSSHTTLQPAKQHSNCKSKLANTSVHAS